MIDGGDANGFTRNINLFSELVSFGYEVVFLTTQKNRLKFPYYTEIRSGVRILAFPEFFPKRFRKGGLSPLSTILKLGYVLFKKADVIYSDMGHRPNSGLPCILHRLIHSSIYLSDWWEHYSKGGIYNDLPKINRLTMGNFDNLFEVRNRKIADGCICISHNLRNRAISNGILNSQLLLLNPGCDTFKIPFKNINSQKFKFDINKDVFVVSIIGINKEEILNNEYLLQSISSLNQIGKKVILLTTGTLDKQVIKNSYISNFWLHFEWLSYKEFCQVISCADIFSLIQIENLRNQSRFPNKFGDYLSAGRPIISNVVGDLKNYSEKYPEYFYVVENNYKSVLQKLTLAYDQWKSNKIDYKKIRDVAKMHSWKERASDLNSFIKKLLKN